MIFSYFGPIFTAIVTSVAIYSLFRILIASDIEIARKSQKPTISTTP